MTKPSKRRKTIEEKVERGKVYSIGEAIALLKECATAKFKECVDVVIRLGVDARKSDQAVRGATILPHGTGKKVRVAVFAEGDIPTDKTYVASSGLLSPFPYSGYCNNRDTHAVFDQG